MININTSSIDWGGLLNKGFEVLQKEVFKTKTSGPIAVAKENDFTPVESGVPAWVVPVAIVAALLMFGKKLFK